MVFYRSFRATGAKRRSGTGRARKAFDRLPRDTEGLVGHSFVVFVVPFGVASGGKENADGHGRGVREREGRMRDLAAFVHRAQTPDPGRQKNHLFPRKVVDAAVALG